MLYGAKLYSARFAQTALGADAALPKGAVESRTAIRMRPPLLA
jgi:hypothetical protein